MNQDSQMPIREFSRMTGLTPDTLRYYDKIGLLSPEVRRENGYRFYSSRQLNFAYIIGSLRDLGVSLEEIRRYSGERTLEKMFALFSQQEKRIQEEIDRLVEVRGIMKLYAGMARGVLNHGENSFFLEERKREPIFCCPPAAAGMSFEAGETCAYDYAGENGINLGSPFGVMVSMESLEERKFFPVHNYFFRVARHQNAWKPAGRYAVAYGRCGIWEPDTVYRKLLSFIGENGLRPCGDAYEEYPLDEAALQGGEEHIVRVEIPVEAMGEETGGLV